MNKKLKVEDLQDGDVKVDERGEVYMDAGTYRERYRAAHGEEPDVPEPRVCVLPAGTILPPE